MVCGKITKLSDTFGFSRAQQVNSIDPTHTVYSTQNYILTRVVSGKTRQDILQTFSQELFSWSHEADGSRKNKKQKWSMASAFLHNGDRFTLNSFSFLCVCTPMENKSSLLHSLC